jgi:two-component system LytT family response regulator
LLSRLGAAGVRVHVGKEAFLRKKTLSEIQQKLGSGTFLRVHRSYIVNAGRSRHVKPLQQGEFAVILDDGTMLDTGRTFRDVIESFLKRRG